MPDGAPVDQPLKVLMTAAEVVPFAKTGGLADVMGSLPKALRQLGLDVRVAMPKYGRIDDARFNLETIGTFDVPFETGVEPVTLKHTMSGPVPVYFIDNARYFNREGIYGYADDGERFIFFCRAALEAVRYLNWQPDIIHCHDWHTAIIPNWLKTIYRADEFFAPVASVYTIHNLAYQGVFGYRILEIAGIAEYGFLYPQIAELANVVDLMGRGIIFADMITTVSETYAREILTPEYGEKLDPLLRDRKERLVGILNGIDYDVYDPRTDPYIAVHYDVHTLDRRIENKIALQREVRLPEDPAVPVLAAISRLTDQKGFDLVAQIIEAVLRQGVQFVLLGTGDQHYHHLFSRIASAYPTQAAVFLTFNTPLAQRIYAGSDIFLMPSRFEPCGLGQMIAMHYGSVPVVRKTGGLADTVQDFDPRTGRGTGFVFIRYDHMDLFAAIIRALETYKYRDVWRSIQVQGMQQDFSWNRSARKYVEVYHKALQYHRGK
jgi:starch synthase